MSATLGDTTFFEKELTRLNGRETALVRSSDRPVPLDFEYSDIALHERIQKLVSTGRVPVYVVCFTQKSCAEEAQNLMSTDFCTKDEKKALAEALRGARFSSPYGKELQRFLRHGIGLHHAGLLPRYRLLVEQLAQKGKLKVVCGTDTLGVGVNVPIRTVLFTKLCKWDGSKTAILSVRDFQQIAGRAGRKGFDDRGTVVAQAPEHVIENLRLEAKAGDDPVKKKRIVRKKPPEHGYVHWDKSTFDRLISSPPEPLESRFQITHAMLLEVLSREHDGCYAMKRLVRDCHDRPAQKRIHRKNGFSLFKSLVEAGVIELRPGGVRVAVDLGEEFSLNQTLSLYVLDTLPHLDPDSPTYALDVVTLVESTLEDPDVVLRRQVDKLKTEKLGELKAAGVEYDQRMAELEKIEHPKPNVEFLYATFDEFRKHHPWVAGENVRPKSVARDLLEQYMSFAEYVKEYGLGRAEGVLLRYLSDAYKALTQTVPDRFRTEELDELVAYLGTLVRGVDASLLDEWEKIRDPERAIRELDEPEKAAKSDVTLDRRAFTTMVRNGTARLVRALARRDWQGAIDLLAETETPWAPNKLDAEMARYFAEHPTLRWDGDARGPGATKIEPSADGMIWNVQQVLFDDEGPTPFFLDLGIDLERSAELGAPAFELRGVRS